MSRRTRGSCMAEWLSLALFACCLCSVKSQDGLPMGVPAGLMDDNHVDGLAGEGGRDHGEAVKGAPPARKPQMVGSDLDPDGPCKEAIATHCSSFLPAGRSLLALPREEGGFPARGNPFGSRFQRVTGNRSAALAHLAKQWQLNHTDQSTAPIAKCLRNTLMVKRSSIVGDSAISEFCKKEVRDFFIWRAQDIRTDYQLMNSCAIEIKKLCSKVLPGGGRILSCLKAKKSQVTSKCSAAISQRQIASGEDIEMDAKVSIACRDDLKKYCFAVKPGKGHQKACLEGISKRNKPGEQLSPECKSSLYRRALEDSEDIRFDFKTAQACAADKAKFCSDIQPGRARVYQCLEVHMDEKGFSSECRKMLEPKVKRKSKDIRMDFRFRARCSDDVQALCPTFSTLVLKPWAKTNLLGSDLIECMREHAEQIKSDQCKEHVYHIQTRGAANPSLDSPLQRGCAAEIKELCNDIQPSQAYLLTQCLRRKQNEGYMVSQQCSSLIMKRLIDATKDFNLNPSVKKMCIREYMRFCKDMSKSNPEDASAEDCLRNHIHEAGFSSSCKDTIIQFSMDTLGDIRLVKDLSAGCKHEVQVLCQGIEPGEGRVISCLQEKRSMVTTSACRDALLRITGMATDDWRMDFGVYNACKADVEEYCQGVEAGQGRVHRCLRANMDRISPRCKMMERRLEEMEAEDIRLNPRLKACIPAARTLCSHAPPGNAARIACLQDHMASPSFPPECYNAMEEVVEKASSRFYLNPRVKTMCDEDVNRFCRWSEMGRDDPDGSILSCLASHVVETHEDCRREIVRTVRLQMWRYKMGTPLTSPCDSDARQLCHVDTMTAAFMEAGFVAECLLRHSSNVSRTCWSLISLPDSDAIQNAAKLEAKYWHMEFAQQALTDVASSMHGDVAKKVQSQMKKEVKRLFKSRESQSFGWSWILSIVLVIVTVPVLGIVTWWALTNRGPFRKGPRVVKDGNL